MSQTHFLLTEKSEIVYYIVSYFDMIAGLFINNLEMQLHYVPSTFLKLFGMNEEKGTTEDEMVGWHH